MRYKLLAALVLLHGAVPAFGQNPGPPRTLPGRETGSDSLPRELVAALLGMSMGRGGLADLRVDLAADGIPEGILAGGRVLGSATMGSASVTAAYMPGPPAVVLDTIRHRLEATGWRSPSPPREERGFIAAYGMDALNQFCRGSDVLTPIVSVRTLDRSLLVLRHQRAPSGASMCAEVPVRSGRGMLAQTPLPALLPPPGTQTTGGGASGGGDGWQIRTHLVGAIPLPDVLRHYESQLVQAGWARLEEAVSSTLVAAAFTIASPNGENWYCAFLASRAPDTAETQLTLQLRRM